MRMLVKLQKVGNSTGLILPEELLAKLRIGLGDTLYATETSDGLQLAVIDSGLESKMAVAEVIMHEDREILRTLGQ
jgi:putative addiction module antidote